MVNFIFFLFVCEREIIRGNWIALERQMAGLALIRVWTLICNKLYIKYFSYSLGFFMHYIAFKVLDKVVNDFCSVPCS